MHLLHNNKVTHTQLMDGVQAYVLVRSLDIGTHHTQFTQEVFRSR